MEIKTKKIKAKSPNKNSNKSIDKYKEFLGEKKDVHKSKDKKVFHVTRKRVSPKKIKKVNTKDLLHIENEISNMKAKNTSTSIQMPTQNENLTSELNKSSINYVENKNKHIKKPVHKPVAKPVVKPVVSKSKKRPTSRSTSRNKKHSKNRKVSIKTGVFRDKDIKNVESKIKEIRKKKTVDIKKELESQGVRVSGKSNRLLRDIYLYSKISNINITHEV